MNRALQLRKGTSLEHSTFTGLLGEITFNVDSTSLVLHDGVTVGGIPVGSSTPLWSLKNTTYTTVSGDKVMIDTTVTPITVNLNSVPVVGEESSFVDAKGTWGVNNFTLVPGVGHTIMGSPNLVNALSSKSFTVVFNGIDWRLL